MSVGNLSDILRAKLSDSDSEENKNSPVNTPTCRIALEALSNSDTEEANLQDEKFTFTPRPFEWESPQPAALKKLKTTQMKDTLSSINEKFKELMAEWKQIKEEAADVNYANVNKMQKTLANFHLKVADTRESLGKIEPSFISILSRLGPGRCKSTMKKGVSRSQLRSEIVQQWGELWLTSYQLDLETKHLSKSIAHLPHLIDLQTKIENQWNKIREFKSSESNIQKQTSWFTEYVYIRENKKEEFQALIELARKNFTSYFKEAKECKLSLQEQLKEFDNIPEEKEFAKELAFGNVEQEEKNIKNFDDIRDQALRDEVTLKNKITDAWKKTCEKLDNLQAKVIQIELTATHPDMLFPYERTARKQMNTDFILNPDITVVEVEEKEQVQQLEIMG